MVPLWDIAVWFSSNAIGRLCNQLAADLITILLLVHSYFNSYTFFVTVITGYFPQFVFSCQNIHADSSDPPRKKHSPLCQIFPVHHLRGKWLAQGHFSYLCWQKKAWLTPSFTFPGHNFLLYNFPAVLWFPIEKPSSPTFGLPLPFRASHT